MESKKGKKTRCNSKKKKFGERFKEGKKSKRKKEKDSMKLEEGNIRGGKNLRREKRKIFDSKSKLEKGKIWKRI